MPTKKIATSLAEGALMDSEASVLATFDFLQSENVVDDEEENLRYAFFYVTVIYTDLTSNSFFIFMTNKNV